MVTGNQHHTELKALGLCLWPNCGMAPLCSLEFPLKQQPSCSLWLPVPSTAHTLNWASGGPVIITILTLASGASAGAICNRPITSQLWYFLVSLTNLRPTSLTSAHDWLSCGIKCLLERNYGEAVINMGQSDRAHYLLSIHKVPDSNVNCMDHHWANPHHI